MRDPLFGNTSTHNCSNSYIVSPRPVVIDSSLRCSEIPSIHLSRPIVCSSFLNCRKHLESSSQEQDQRLQKWKVAEMKIKSLGGDLVRCIADSDNRFEYIQINERHFSILNERMRMKMRSGGLPPIAKDGLQSEQSFGGGWCDSAAVVSRAASGGPSHCHYPTLLPWWI